MKRKGSRGLTPAFKRDAVGRMVAGVKVAALARALGVNRQRLYEWRDSLRAGDALMRRVGRPKTAPPRPARATDLAGAQKRVAALERRLGQQQLEIDFFRQALRQVRALRGPDKRPGATASTPSSRR